MLYLEWVPMDDFVNSHTVQLEDTGSLSYADIPDVVIFHHTISEKPPLNIISDAYDNKSKCSQNLIFT